MMDYSPHPPQPDPNKGRKEKKMISGLNHYLFNFDVHVYVRNVTDSKPTGQFKKIHTTSKFYCLFCDSACQQACKHAHKYGAICYTSIHFCGKYYMYRAILVKVFVNLLKNKTNNINKHRK